MAPNIEISIPTTTLSHTSPPHTLYHITLRLPLRSFNVSKRYSDFAAFHSNLISQTNAEPPIPLPSKSWFSKTVSNERFREERRRGLETYLRAINEASDGRWRTSSAWRAFLNLPTAAAISTSNGTSNTSSRLHAAITDPGSAANTSITDPTLWLDYYRDMKSHLHDARLQLSRRDQETTPQKQHESSAQAKTSLVRAGSMITTLEEGLKNLGGRGTQESSKSSTLGDGELRRRKDLLINARRERDGLEDLLHAMAAKSRLDQTVASVQDKEALLRASGADAANGGRRTPARSGRVLGKETERTRELDNEGVLQLQQQTIRDQDQSVEELMKIIIRQRELGTAIHEELEIQNELLKLADEDTDRCVSRLLDSLGMFTDCGV
jgi:regulator of vacuolar morphogenesis